MLASNRMTTIHMRKHPKNKKTMDVLKAEGMLTDEMAAIIKRKQEAGEGFLICGKNGSGKTTFMNAAIETYLNSYLFSVSRRRKSCFRQANAISELTI